MPTVVKKSKVKKQAAVTREPLSLRQKEIIVRAAILSEERLATALKHVDPEKHFSKDEEAWLGLVWAGVKAAVEHVRNGNEDDNSLPPQGMLAEFIQRLAEHADADAYDADDVDEVNAFIADTIGLSESETAREGNLFKRYLEQLLTEGLQDEIAQKLSETGKVHDLPTLLEGYGSQAQQVKSVNVGKLDVPFPKDQAHEIPLIKVSTGLDFFDDYLGGGQAGGEVYGLCAPYGVCKTTLAVQLGVRRAERDLLVWGDKNREGQVPRVYLVFYEELIKSVRVRCLSCCGEIDRGIIESGQMQEFMRTQAKNPHWIAGIEDEDEAADVAREVFREMKANKYTFSTGILRNFKPYEESMTYGIAGELERYKLAISKMNYGLRFIDFTGRNAEYREPSGQMAKGIKAVIDQDQRESGSPGVSMVIADYAGAAADRAIEINELRTDDLRHLVGKFPLRLKHNIAAHFDCPVWVMHQLSTDANSRAAGVAPKNTDTAEAKNFFEHVDFGFLIGTKSDQSMAILHNGKQRREAMRGNTILKIEGNMSRVTKAGQNFIVESGQIMDRKELGRMADVELSEGETVYNGIGV